MNDERKGLLAIDPGISTGWAFFNEEGLKVDGGTIGIEDLEDSVLANPSEVFVKNLQIVIEEFPPQVTDERVRKVQWFFKLHLPQALTIRPSVYLPVMEKRSIPRTRAMTIHEEEATKLGLYYLQYHLPKRKGA